MKKSSSNKTELILDSSAKFIFRITNESIGDAIIISTLTSVYGLYHTLKTKKFSVYVLFYDNRYIWHKINLMDIAPVSYKHHVSGLFMFCNELAYRQFPIGKTHSFLLLKTDNMLDDIRNDSNVITWLISVMSLSSSKFKLVFDKDNMPKKEQPYTSLVSVIWFNSLMEFILNTGNISIENKNGILLNYSEICDELRTYIDRYVKDPYDHECLLLSGIISSGTMMNSVLLDDRIIDMDCNKFPDNHLFIAQLLGKSIEDRLKDEVVRCREYKSTILKSKEKPIRIVLDSELRYQYDGLLIVSNNCILRFNDARR